jgi:ABC-type transport system substrate-binding protein
MAIVSEPAILPEMMSARFSGWLHSGAVCQLIPDYFMLPLNNMYSRLLRTKNRDKRFEIYRKANEYVADQAFYVATLAPLSLYGVNEHLNFVPQVSQYLYLDYSSVTEHHSSIRGKNNSLDTSSPLAQNLKD